MSSYLRGLLCITGILSKPHVLRTYAQSTEIIYEVYHVIDSIVSLVQSIYSNCPSFLNVAMTIPKACAPRTVKRDHSREV